MQWLSHAVVCLLYGLMLGDRRLCTAFELLPLVPCQQECTWETGVAAFAAEAKYDSLLLDIISFVSAIALATRIILGYRRMSQRCAHKQPALLCDVSLGSAVVHCGATICPARAYLAG